MKRRWLAILIMILILLFAIELFSSRTSFILIILGILLIALHDRVSSRRPEIPLVIGGVSLLFGLLSTKMIWILIILVLVIFVSQNPELLSILKEGLQKKASWKNDEFVLVRFREGRESLAKVQKHRWFGDDRLTQEKIYAWEDVNYTKIYGNSVIDLSNTVLPKGENIVIIRQGIGTVKILVPKEVTISLNVSSLMGKLSVGEDELFLRNESVIWQSEKFQPTSRKIKLAINILFGQVQVIFL